MESSLCQLTSPVLSLSIPGVSYLGQKLEGYASTRNLEQFELELFKLDPADLFAANWFKKRGEMGFGQLLSGETDRRLVEELLAGADRVKTLTVKAAPAEEYEFSSTAFTVPLEETGLYLYRAQTEQALVLGFLTHGDMILVTRTLPGKSGYYAAEAVTGEPLEGVPITVREVLYRQGLLLDYQDVIIHDLKTNAAGMADFKFSTGSRIYSNQASAFAVKDGAVAISEYDYPLYVDPGSRAVAELKGFIHTDRPVYRPGDTVRFRIVTRSYTRGRYGAAGEIPFKIFVTDPNGNTVLEREIACDRYGAVNGSFELPEGGKLGSYYFGMTRRQQNRDWAQVNWDYIYLSAGSYFQVEEYKKPEYRVEVVPSTPHAVAGEKVSAEIRATYYFGGPVAGGEVRYTVYRTPYLHQWTPPNRFDWLYGAGYGAFWPHELYYRAQEVALEGSGTTDAKGKLVVELPPLPEDQGRGKQDYTYSVTATVSDLSRRTVSGTGSVIVSRSPFFIHFNQQTGFYLSGDEPEVEVLAMTANDKPVRAEGSFKVFVKKYSYGKKEPELVEVDGGDLELDGRGRGYVKTKLPEEGIYQLLVELEDEAGGRAEAAHDVHVIDRESNAGNLSFSTLSLLPNKRSYRPGETAGILLGTTAPGWVLLTAEGGGEVFYQKLMRVEKTGVALDIKIEDRHVPNFHVAAGMVHDRQFFMANVQLFVPPEDKLLKVEVAADKKEYRPGETGKIEVTVTDHAGEGVEAQVGLWMFDSSLLHIQPETFGDIRQYFYGQLRYQGVSYKYSGYAYMPNRFYPLVDPPKFRLEGLPYVPDYRYMGNYYPGFRGPGPGYGEYGGGNLYANYDFSDSYIDGAINLPQTSARVAETPAAPPAAHAQLMPMKMARLDVPDPAAAALRPVAVREFFPDTILWRPAVTTGKAGKATVEVEFPDSLTTWAIRAVAADRSDMFGQGAGEAVSSKRLVARLETPRFLVEGDTATLAAVVRSTLDEEVDVALELESAGTGLLLAGERKAEMTLAPGGEKRVDFRVSAVAVGRAGVTLRADAGAEADALKRSFPIIEHGAEVLEHRYIEVKGTDSGRMEFSLPAERRRETTEITVVANASLGGVLVATLPYLLDYPYGCVEQTVSRFLPAVLVRSALGKAGISLGDVGVLPDGADLAHPLARPSRWRNRGVFSEPGLEQIIDAGLCRLSSMQNYDGGWGWWGGGASDTYMTAYVLMGLVEAQEADVAVTDYVVERGMSYLEARAQDVALRNRHLNLFVAYVLSLRRPVPARVLDKAMEERKELSAYGKSLLALALWNSKRKKEAQLVLDNLKNLAWLDKENGAASFKHRGSTGWWRWWENRVEKVTWALSAFMEIRPDDEIVPMLARWLVQNREGSHWDSTKSTSLAVMALVDYMEARGELEAEYTAVLKVNGERRKSFTVTPKNALTLSQSLRLGPEELPADDLVIEVEVEGKGTLHCTAFASYFSKAEKISSASSQIRVQRSYSRLTPVLRLQKQPFGAPALEVRDYERHELTDGDTVKSGDLVEVRVAIEAPNDYEYLVFEDPKPAGFEPVEQTSGYIFENGASWYREYRARKVVSFLDFLNQGTQVITYQLIAEIPGRFHVLPHQGHAMYAPRVRANSESATIGISSR